VRDHAWIPLTDSPRESKGERRRHVVFGVLRARLHNHRRNSSIQLKGASYGPPTIHQAGPIKALDASVATGFLTRLRDGLLGGEGVTAAAGRLPANK
jgi:hypothetical protein